MSNNTDKGINVEKLGCWVKAWVIWIDIARWPSRRLALISTPTSNRLNFLVPLSFPRRAHYHTFGFCPCDRWKMASQCKFNCFSLISIEDGPPVICLRAIRVSSGTWEIDY